MYQRGHTPPQEQRSEDVARIPRSQIHRREREHEHEQLAEATRRPRHIRRRCGNYRGGDRETHQRELRRLAEARDLIEGLRQRLLVDELGHRPGHDCGKHPCDREVARQSPATADECGRGDDQDRPERPRPVQRLEEGLEVVGETVEEPEQVLIRVARIVVIGDHHHEGEDRHRDPHPVARTTPVRLLRRRTERMRGQAPEAFAGTIGASLVARVPLRRGADTFAGAHIALPRARRPCSSRIAAHTTDSDFFWGAGCSWGSSRVNPREMRARSAAPRRPALSARSWAVS